MSLTKLPKPNLWTGPLQSQQTLEPPTEGLGASVWASAPSMGLGTRGPGIKENGELFFSWRDVWKDKAAAPLGASHKPRVRFLSHPLAV